MQKAKNKQYSLEDQNWSYIKSYEAIVIKTN